MKLVNHTNLPNVLIREVIRTVRPPGIEIKEIKVWDCKSFGEGTAWRKRVLLRVPTTDKRARHRWRAYGAYLPVDVGSRIEALVMITAHELRHLWQAQGPHGLRKKRPGMVWGARGVRSERDADAYALHKLRQWRRGELS